MEIQHLEFILVFGGFLQFLAPILGAAIGGGIDAASTSATNALSAEEAQKNRWFQQSMQETAYARNMKSMKDAGLNPMLAMGHGAQSTPSGGQASFQANKVGETLSRGVSSAIDARRLKKEIEATESQIGLNEATAAYQRSQDKLAQTNAKLASKNAEVIDAQMPAVRAKSKLDEVTAGYDLKAAPIDAFNNRLNRLSQTGANIVDMFKPGFKIQGPKVETPSEGFRDRTGRVHKRP